MMLDDVILRFFRDDIGGILITNEEGYVIYEDEKSAFIRAQKTNWKAACPLPHSEQRGEIWDLICTDTKKTYMVITSSFEKEDQLVQVHFLVDTSLYSGMFRDMSSYSRSMKNDKERDGLTGLYNRDKFVEMKRTLFVKQKNIAVFNMDINNLKKTNDTFGHETGDVLIKKAAESLKKIEARNVIPFRTGGDEFVVVAIHVGREEAEQIRKNWEAGLDELNQRDDGVRCSVACGFVFAEQGYDLEAVFAEADRQMYENKKTSRQGR